MSRVRFKNKTKPSVVTQKRETTNKHWDAVYKVELKKNRQKENEIRYVTVIKYVTESILARNKDCITKREIDVIIKEVFSKSKYIRDRFERRRTRYL